ncbi:P-loop containing nucleoside triphosphate hydrolase protein [Echria macrotheca]|uniref:P-loop containing nucleoside triphosphate hydrolase protein n=1 Tax=Echria macrotheca TaxID=438768 RepID=A0AAJ0FDV2_9PEZI|nr:P-loop containing nucleoside triphosphate hydrolase protein [Echria macrotheca]
MASPLRVGIKRPRQDADDDASSFTSASPHSPVQRPDSAIEGDYDYDESDGYPAKRQRFDESANLITPDAVDGDSDVGFLQIHEVSCARGHQSHANHPRAAFFFDHPRLNIGDCVLTPLHGKFPLKQDLEDYIRERPDISFVVLRRYDCEQYHSLIEDEFEKQPLPYLPRSETSAARPYYTILNQPGPLADANQELIQTPSPSFVRAMRDLVEYDHLTFGGWDLSQHLEAPYVHFYHTREAMKALPQDAVSRAGHSHIRVLLKYLDDSFGHEYEEADDLFARGVVTLKHLPKLFRTNDLVVCVQEGQPRAFSTVTCTPSPHTVHIECTTWDFDGAFYEAKQQLRVRWQHDDDEIPIVKLTVYPLRYDTSGLKEKLLARGNTFWSCRGRRFISYAPPRRTFELRNTNVRYMVDMETYKHIHEQDAEPRTHDVELGQTSMTSEAPPSDEFTLQLPSRIRGFGLHDKKWRFLLVDYIQPIKWNKTAFDRLVLDPDKKSLITAMVNEHLLSDVSADVIEGKGNGLIILLHGGPGTGKTLTAESVAELAEKPLYRVTCGDIGTDAETVEKYLESVLYIGTIWKAVVLFDESDVFLEERSQADLQRNALVSVFLRVLEYYDGILILTSNRVGTFDEAFKSRVQLALHYPAIDERGREEIWLEFIQDLQKQGADANYPQLRERIPALARNPLNGRQIRNAIRTARQLASQAKQPLSYDHLRKAIKVAHEFEQYVVETHGGTTDEEYAKLRSTRVR